jgi:hypothetical protein
MADRKFFLGLEISGSDAGGREADICVLACAYPRHFCLGYLAVWNRHRRPASAKLR